LDAVLLELVAVISPAVVIIPAIAVDVLQVTRKLRAELVVQGASPEAEPAAGAEQVREGRKNESEVPAVVQNMEFSAALAVFVLLVQQLGAVSGFVQPIVIDVVEKDIVV